MISEHDIEDWVDVGQPVKLYDVPRNSVVKIEGDVSGTRYWFDHLDGMYSFCRVNSPTGEVCHLAAFTDVILQKYGK